MYIEREQQWGAQNYAPLPVVLNRGKGAYLYGVDGTCYLDCLAAYGSVNQGHCHPKIVKALQDQAALLGITGRAFYNDKLGEAEEFVCKLFGYERALFMNTGAEAVETAIKLARRWGYDVKGIPKNEALIIVANNNFHGRTTGVISFSTDPDAREGFGPFMPGFLHVALGDVEALQVLLEKDGERICGFLVEPIQGEAGVIIPEDETYLAQCQSLLQKHNALLIADEIQSGLGRTGKWLASDHANLTKKPDIVCMAKALSGGTMPISCVLADSRIMLTIKPNQHGSTFGGNPTACAVAIAALKVLQDEQLIENSEKMGSLLKEGLALVQKDHPNLIKQVRGLGLMLAVDIILQDENKSAYDFCLDLMKEGILSKPTHEHTIRLTPPLVIGHPEVEKICEAIKKVARNWQN